MIMAWSTRTKDPEMCNEEPGVLEIGDWEPEESSHKDRITRPANHGLLW